MIHHHAQALVMTAMAPSHGAGPQLQLLAARITNAQHDEIALMQQWLRDRSEPVPAADATHLRMTMNGMEHDMIMPGMLNEQELAGLRNSRGQEFDRLFLTYMIQHHRGAVSMVDDLFATDGAAQDEAAFKLASDIHVDQLTEIARMRLMLRDLADSGS